MVSAKEFFLRGGSFMYVMNSKRPTIDLWGSLYVNVPQSGNKIRIGLCDYIFNFLFSVC